MAGYDASGEPCPACGHRGRPIVTSTAGPTAFAIFIGAMFCLSWACCLISNIPMYTRSSYCERCGLRIVTEENEASQVQYDSRNTAPWPSDIALPSVLRSMPEPPSIAISPLGFPVAVERSNIVNSKKRFRTLSPVQILNIETGDFKLPRRFIDITHPGAGYTIESPGIPRVAPDTWTDPQYLLTSCAWNHGTLSTLQSPHFRVSRYAKDSPSLEIAHIELFGNGDWNAEIHMLNYQIDCDGNRTRNLDDKEPYSTYPMKAAGARAWRTYDAHPGVLWNSSQGVLLWNERELEDAEKVKGRLLCLVDAYDRLIAVLRKTTRPGQRGKLREMRVYATLREDFLGEVIASYTALVCQQQRLQQQSLAASPN